MIWDFYIFVFHERELISHILWHWFPKEIKIWLYFPTGLFHWWFHDYWQKFFNFRYNAIQNNIAIYCLQYCTARAYNRVKHGDDNDDNNDDDEHNNDDDDDNNSNDNNNDDANNNDDNINDGNNDNDANDNCIVIPWG